MKLDPIKLKRQEGLINIGWAKSGWIGTIMAVMGFGKTYCGKLAIEKLNKLRPGEKTIIVVPGEPIYDTWMSYIKEFNLKDVEVYIINTAIQETRHCHLLILDEVHRYLNGDKWSLVTEMISRDKVLGLSGTLTKEEKEKLKVIAPVFDEVPWGEALKNGYISNFTLHNVPIDLDETTYQAYRAYSMDLGRALGHFGSGKAGFARMSGIMNPDWRRKNSSWIAQSNLNVGQMIGLAKKGLTSTRNRVKLIQEFQERYDALEDIVDVIPDKKLVIFSMTNEVTDMITEMFKGSVSYHSDMGEFIYRGKSYKGIKARRKIIELFNKDIIKHINATKALDEGITLKGLDTSIIASNNSTARMLEQRLGRNIRFLEGRYAHIIYLYIRKTMEEKWKKKSQLNIKKYVQEYQSLNQFTEQFRHLSR